MNEYDEDFFNWTCSQSLALKKGEIEKLDFENLVEEIESLGRSDKRSLRSHLVNLLLHMLKTRYQPEKKTCSWDESIRNAKLEIELILDDSPSLHIFSEEIVEHAYRMAVKKACIETKIPEKFFPCVCPWSKEEIYSFLN